MRFFNTAGPVNCNKHYCLNPMERFNLKKIAQAARENIKQTMNYLLRELLSRAKSHLNDTGMTTSNAKNIKTDR